MTRLLLARRFESVASDDAVLRIIRGFRRGASDPRLLARRFGSDPQLLTRRFGSAARQTDFLQAEHPAIWGRNNGADHIFFAGGDRGACPLPADERRFIWMVHFGLTHYRLEPRRRPSGLRRPAAHTLPPVGSSGSGSGSGGSGSGSGGGGRGSSAGPRNAQLSD